MCACVNVCSYKRVPICIFVCTPVSECVCVCVCVCICIYICVTTGGCCAGLNRTTQHRGRFKGRNVLLAEFGTQVGSPEVGKQIQTGNRQENSCRAGRGQKHE